VCSAWDKFENFFADMGQRPSPIHMLERKNNDGDYEPSNCRWATRSEQQRNRRNNVVIHAFGQSKTATDWLPEAKVSFNTIVRRIRMGIDPEIAISTPRNCL
jgi:hypothetical protein